MHFERKKKNNMENSFQVFALKKTQFEQFFDLNETELAEKGIKKMIVDEFPGFPCRVSLADAEVGEEVILLNYEPIASCLLPFAYLRLRS